jgi:hypothetical protein
MNSVFAKYMDKFILMLIDDILIYEKNEDEHEHHLRIVLQTLREHELYVKLSKCEFYQQRIQYLGHVISEEGIALDLYKIKSIMEWTVPKDIHDVRAFMGIIGYYRMFIEGFSN